ncbi:putative bifunctional diguanylate cyclase/phosphodiesterase [Tumebacillus permanentifrigoris]|uniref:Diguanylate cyclase (GGDEF)-like protein n=1 Tax=Tumebacillus permanentifrigoris TaxID=378543 RepID=A0A316DE08_9BACL|nr:EAL domain-containing protein [Tumebacillus permanentifrigoris]PWK16205.1 diguanylate cyclase (GGDEF)-like protein [Tumebacillus permanentifrigoris]
MSIKQTVHLDTHREMASGSGIGSGIGKPMLLRSVFSFAVSALFLLLLDQGRAHHMFGLPWVQPDEETVVLWALIINVIQLSMVCFGLLFLGYNVITHDVRRHLYKAYSVLLAVSYLALVVKYFAGPTVEVISQVIGLVGFLGIPVSLYALYAMVGVYRNIEMRLQSAEELSVNYYKQLITDPLTGLPNRILFQDELNKRLAVMQRTGTPLGILFLDLDRFKFINDTLGHRIGDLLLRAVVKRLQAVLEPTETIYRLGGDEFIIVAEVGSKEQGIERAQALLLDMKEPFQIEGHELFITTSIGLSWYPDDGLDMETLFKNADMALYRAKDQGRNNFQMYDSGMNVHAVERLQMEKDLRKALEREEFLVYYQPQIDIKSNRMIGMEALVRWQHPERGMIAPGLFIPLAEETDLIVPLGEWVMRTACAQTKRWHDAGYPDIRVSINLSAHQFGQATLAAKVCEILEQTGIAPRYVDLEITESITMTNVERAISTMLELKNLGLHISIDDFGTGYSSLSYLKKFPIQTLKIDQSFVRDIPQDPDDAAIATAVIAMAHSLNLNVIAEGVETEEQLEFLRERNCDEFQGYLCSRPLPVQEFEKLLQQELQMRR